MWNSDSVYTSSQPSQSYPIALDSIGRFTCVSCARACCRSCAQLVCVAMLQILSQLPNSATPFYGLSKIIGRYRFMFPSHLRSLFPHPITTFALGTHSRPAGPASEPRAKTSQNRPAHLKPSERRTLRLKGTRATTTPHLPTNDTHTAFHNGMYGPRSHITRLQAGGRDDRANERVLIWYLVTVVHQGQGRHALGQEQGGVEEAAGRAEAGARAIADTEDRWWCAEQVEQDVSIPSTPHTTSTHGSRQGNPPPTLAHSTTRTSCATSAAMIRLLT